MEDVFINSDNDSDMEEEVKKASYAGSRFSFNVKFPAPDVEKQEKCQLVDTDQEWRWVKNGFNYGGYCQNKKCKSNLQGDGFVVCKRGYGSIRPNEDVFYGVVRCRGCDNMFNPSEFIIKKAVGSLNYALMGYSEIETIKIRCIGNDNCQVFGQSVDRRWYSLMVFILKSPVVAVHVKQFSKEVTWSRRVYDIPENASEKRAPMDIRFCQESIKRKFQCGRLLSHTLWELRKKRVTVYDIPIISIFKMNKRWYTSDNRRLWVYQAVAKSDPNFRIPVKVIKKFQVRPSKITTQNEGKFVRLRNNC